MTVTPSGARGTNGRVHGRDVPERHRAIAAELEFRDDVAGAQATASGVGVWMADGTSDLPAWIYEKADVAGIDLEVDGESPDPPDRSDIRSARQASGLTQREIADALGVHRGLVSKWEVGTKPLRRARAEQVRQVCERVTPAVTDGGER